MPRFVTDRDMAFFQHISKELVDTVIETVITLYKLSVENSKVNIYGEATTKQYYVGTKIPCLINRQNTQPSQEAQTVDTVQTAKFQFLRVSLEEIKVYPEVGDFIEFQGGYYEINNTTENQLVAGQPQFNYSIVCEAHLTRKSNLQLDERTQ